MRARYEGPVPPQPAIVRAAITETADPEILDAHHLGALRLAIEKLLSTELAEFTYAQIIDGLPTTDSFFDFHSLYRDSGHPIKTHETLCDEALERARAFRSKFDLMSLRFDPTVTLPSAPWRSFSWMAC